MGKLKPAQILARAKRLATQIREATEIPPKTRSEAARLLGLRRAQKAGHDELSRIGTLGAKKYWENVGDNRLRALEAKRRGAVRRKNRRERIRKAIEGK